MFEFIDQELNELHNSGLYRTLKTIEKVTGTKVTINGKECINFASNNYLGLSQHPEVIEKAVQIVREFGVGSGASRLISGNTIIHEALESKIAAFKGRETAIVFPTGYMANLGAITSLVDEKDTVIIDRLNHASIVDASKLSKAKLQVFKHCDMGSLETILKKSDKFKKRLIITDAIFSMDGDIAPLPEINKLAKKYAAMVMVDEAHSTGVLGARGKGIEEHFDIEGQTDFIMGTLSKAVGSLGGFIAGSEKLIDYLRNKARSFIYTTALPPAICAASLAALEIIEKDNCYVRKLAQNIHQLNSLLGTKSVPPIFPVLTKRPIEDAEKLFNAGYFVIGIRPPTVPKNESRLRITLSAEHSKEEIECLASLLQELIPA
ncbi:MAG: 8-amino-7-oxononanoate synthase [Candidatus Margulisiibacteriota bacterium]